jgi:cytochrome c oxidase subunit 4
MDKKEEHTIVAYRTYVFVWTGLLVLTWLTVTVAKMHLGNLSVVSPLLIGSLKAFLVLGFFMHLRYEKGMFKIMLIVVVATATVLIGLLFSDVAYR